MTSMTTPSIEQQAVVRHARSETDPILLELWEIKRQINEQAHFDIGELARHANQFDIKLAMKKLGVLPTVGK
jgi:hypothetical protein